MNRRKRHIYQAWHNYVLDCSLNFQEEYKVDGFNDDGKAIVISNANDWIITIRSGWYRVP